MAEKKAALDKAQAVQDAYDKEHGGDYAKWQQTHSQEDLWRYHTSIIEYQPIKAAADKARAEYDDAVKKAAGDKTAADAAAAGDQDAGETKPQASTNVPEPRSAKRVENVPPARVDDEHQRLDDSSTTGGDVDLARRSTGGASAENATGSAPSDGAGSGVDESETSPDSTSVGSADR
ncbi:hypothetical protein [Mycolicibacterium madagascariense]|uniref:hypothetical protein n=1 Tax=Mycolicibacterium madagascariense TaxID=212765 RepID=UPI0021F3844E|nr:hypothetical protein [Mycolicibacterium madagascariense]MCV7013608.1 hypothetical protein [Mycolicibacterium madagascariense]